MGSPVNKKEITLEEMVCRSKVGHKVKAYDFADFMKISEGTFEHSLKLMLFLQLMKTTTGRDIAKDQKFLYCSRCHAFDMMEGEEFEKRVKAASEQLAKEMGYFDVPEAV